MKDELVLSLKHVTSGYREGGIFRKKTYQEVLHDVQCHGGSPAFGYSQNGVFQILHPSVTPPVSS